MKGKYGKDKKKHFIMLVAAVPLLVLLSYGAVRMGILAGNLLFNMDNGFVGKVDTGNFKIALNYSYPLMDTVYNSGNIDVSVIGEIENLVGDIFNFDLRTPVTILNAQSPFLHSYYSNSYIPMQAELMRRDALNESRNPEGETDTKAPGSTPMEQTAEPPQPPNEGKPGEEGIKPDNGSQALKEDASSIYYEGESEDKSPGIDITHTGNIQIQNEAGLKIDIEKLLKEPLKFNLKKKGPKVLIYHTHTTESFIKAMADLNKKGVSSWNSDPRYNVVKVGDELAVQLKKKYGVEVLHNGTIHNIPDQNKAYVASLQTLTSYLKSYPSLQITVDLHRDASGNGSEKLRLPVKVKGKNAAQIMFVIGTNHPNWKENLKLALKMQEQANKLYPGLAKPIWIAKSKRYNQHLRYGSFTVEIGGDGNTLAECQESARCLATIMGEVMKGIK